MAWAQTVEFAPVGAEWYYERIYHEGWNPTGITYDRFRSLRTLEINGWECKEIELYQHLDCYGVPNPVYEYRYITQEGNQVYEVENGERFLLYDFDKGPGEYWYAQKYNDTIKIISVSHMTLNDGSIRKVLEAEPSNPYWYYFHIIEGIGLDYSLYPFELLVGKPCLEGPIRCYSEDGIPLIESETECVYETLGIGEQKDNPMATILPLVGDMLGIEFSPDVTPVSVELYDLQGRKVLSQTGTFDRIPVAGLPAGTYLVRMLMDDGKVWSEKVVKR